MPFRQSDLITKRREQVFHLTSLATGGPLLGQTFATTDLQFRKPGAALYANCDAGQQAAVVETGGGDYVYTYLSPEIDTFGTGHMFKVNKTGALLWTAPDEILQAFFATAITGTLSANAFTTSRTEAVDNYWNDCLVEFLTGNLAGQVKPVATQGGYVGATKLINLRPGYAFSGAPANGDIFEFINR